MPVKPGWGRHLGVVLLYDTQLELVINEESRHRDGDPIQALTGIQPPARSRYIFLDKPEPQVYVGPSAISGASAGRR